MTRLLTLANRASISPFDGGGQLCTIHKAKDAYESIFYLIIKMLRTVWQPLAATSERLVCAMRSFCIAPRPYTIEKSAAAQVIAYQTWLSCLYVCISLAYPNGCKCSFLIRTSVLK